jgi:hypothetical protein
MPRRRELADVADGISGHFVTGPYWSDDWPLGVVALAIQRSAEREFSFDLLSGTVSPRAPYLEARAEILHSELLRHLAARNLPQAWVATATLAIWVGEAEESVGPDHPVRCQVAITDDLGRVHTSTRRGFVEPEWVRTSAVMAMRSLMARIRGRFKRGG